MTFYNREGVLYVRLNGRRFSTRMEDTLKNRKLFESYYKNDEFLKKFNLDTVKIVPSFCSVLESVLDDKELYLKNTSYNSYLSMYNSRIKPYFKDKKINVLTRKDILLFYGTIKDKSTLNIIHTLIFNTFEKALILEYIDFIPTIKKPKLKESTYQINPFTVIEMDNILNNCDDDIVLKNLLGVLFYSGMRCGELFGLHWCDIDFDTYTININKTITNGYTQTPKTKSSLRVVDMLPQTEQFLRSQLKITGLSKFVFLKPRGGNFNRSADFIQRWKKLLSALKLDYRNIHQLRHSFASNMLQNGEELNWVSFMLGHKSPFITLQKYTRYIKPKRVERKKTFLDVDNTKTTQCR
jgi:integrase